MKLPLLAGNASWHFQLLRNDVFLLRAQFIVRGFLLQINDQRPNKTPQVPKKQKQKWNVRPDT